MDVQREIDNNGYLATFELIKANKDEQDEIIANALATIEAAEIERNAAFADMQAFGNIAHNAELISDSELFVLDIEGSFIQTDLRNSRFVVERIEAAQLPS